MNFQWFIPTVQIYISYEFSLKCTLLNPENKSKNNKLKLWFLVKLNFGGSEVMLISLIADKNMPLCINISRERFLKCSEIF